jgi:hypothetical protein
MTTPAPNIIDLTARLNRNSYSPGRAGIGVKCAILHDTTGTAASPDTNSGNLNFAAREQGTANYLLTSGAASIHYMVGPERTGAKTYRLCPEEHTAWHAAGVPTRNVFVAPDGTRLEGSLGGVSKLNRASIGIERWGIPNETVGPNQTQAMISLVVDLARRHSLKPEQIITHKFVQTDRSDGEVLLDECRAAVADMWRQSNQPPAVRYDLPFGAVLQGDGSLWFPAYGGRVVRHGFLHYFLTAGDTHPLTLDHYANMVERGVYLFGLPLEDEHPDPKGRVNAIQNFERYTLEYDASATGKWVIRGGHIKR